MIAVAVAPTPVTKVLADAITSAGGTLVDTAQASVIIWADHRSQGFQEMLATAPNAKWIQLASAGIEWVFAEGLYSDRYVWTCAKGDTYGQNVAEHAVLLLLSSFREMRSFMGATEWLPEGGRALAGRQICIVGAGGIGTCLLKLLAPFNVTTTVVKRRLGDVVGATKVVGQEDLLEAVSTADATILALPLTSQTSKMFDDRVFAAMKPGAWIINVSRGGLIDTAALLTALERGHLGGAALDVTDPEPLPQGHPLWTHPHVIVTPHIANTEGDNSPQAFATRVAQNITRWNENEPLLGRIDPEAGY